LAGAFRDFAANSGRIKQPIKAIFVQTKLTKVVRKSAKLPAISVALAYVSKALEYAACIGVLSGEASRPLKGVLPASAE
jgi:hypothetical protein